MTKDVIVFHDHRANATSVPEVNVRAELWGEALAGEVDEGQSETYPQMPVLLMPMVTSPSLSPSPL